VAIAAAQSPSFDFSGAVQSAKAMPRLHSLLVSWQGELVFEQYFNGRSSNDLAKASTSRSATFSPMLSTAAKLLAKSRSRSKIC
jgi:hypothetical protein